MYKTKSPGELLKKLIQTFCYSATYNERSEFLLLTSCVFNHQLIPHHIHLNLRTVRDITAD